MPDIPGDATTSAVVTDGSVTPGAIEVVGDHDWYKVTLGYGQTVTITATGGGGLDPYLNVYDSTGTTILASNDDIAPGVNNNSRVTFTPTQAGTYFIDVGASHDLSTGTYDLLVQPKSNSIWSFDQIANQLTTYFWGGDTHHWAVTQGGTLTVDIHTLTADEQTLAQSALASWSDIIGVHFQQVSSGAQIVFSDAEDATANGPIAQADVNWSNGIITSADIQISKSWVTTYGSGLDTYSFQTYVHEIGHALGLGHAGEYNETGSFQGDAVFANDAWSTSVMSYFSQHDNGYFNNQGFSEDYVLTPMVADILAMQQLYGLSTTTRTGDTTYGYNSNADNPVYNAAIYPHAAFTIYDSGGNDTLDYSLSSANQLINLNPDTFSNVNGETGNLMIGPGVVIENAIGGSGNDTIIANSANNVLAGGAGTDTLSYESATAGVTINLGLTTPQNTGGSGVDSVSGFENLIGSAYGDDLIGGPSSLSISGGAGDDRIEAGTANPAAGLTMNGGDGNDTFVLGAGAVHIDGGAGFNIVDGSNAPAGLLLFINGQPSGGADSLYNVQEIIGSAYADNLTATAIGDVLIGGPGNDTLTSYGGAQLAGGTGNDTYNASSTTDQIIENPGEGTDTVNAATDYTLGPNLENLTLHEYLPWDPYAGAAVQPNPPPENWSATGNDLANVITGNQGNNVLTGLGGADTLTGGGGEDTFKDTAAGLNGDTITDFNLQDKIVITDAILSGFSFHLSGNTLSFTGGSLTLSSVPGGHFVAAAAASGGVQLSLAPERISNDFNGDGRSDILWLSDFGAVTQWLGTPTGGFVQNQGGIGAGPSVHSVGVGDFNGDGRSDALWRDNFGHLTEWLGGPNGTIAPNYSFTSPAADTSWQVVGTGDFNGDGTSDLLWRNSGGYLTEWLGTTNGNFVSNEVIAGTGAADATWQVAGTGDFNGDGISDILWRNVSSGYITEWLGTSNGSFHSNQANAGNGSADNSWQITGTGDFNGDGISDILWRNASSGYLTEWLGTANGGFIDNASSAATGAADNTWHVVSIGDFNGDGKDDLLWRNSSGYTTEWLGTSTGGFSDNAAHAATGAADNTWHVQDPFL